MFGDSHINPAYLSDRRTQVNIDRFLTQDSSMFHIVPWLNSREVEKYRLPGLIDGVCDRILCKMMIQDSSIPRCSRW